jgi:hypothetical protein
MLISSLSRMTNQIDTQNDVLALQDVSTGETVGITLNQIFTAEDTTNEIGTPGAAGFGVGVYPDTLPAYMTAMSGTFDPTHANYGNYQVTTDSSVMCYIPRFYFKVTNSVISGMTGDGTNVTLTLATAHNYTRVGEKVYIEGAAGFVLPAGLYTISAIDSSTQIKITSTFNTGTYTASSASIFNSVQIRGQKIYTTEAEANLDGFVLHRAFFNAGAEVDGFFVDKYKWSLTNYADGTAGIASSIALSNPISSNVASKRDGTNPTFAGSFVNCKSNGQTPTDTYGGAFAAAKSRGNDFSITPIFVNAALALLSLAHGQASTGTALCAWFKESSAGARDQIFPKGHNNVSGGRTDANDPSIEYSVCDDGYWSGRSEAMKNGSANSLAKTTHNGQSCGVADLNGNQYEFLSGFTTGGYVSKAITGISRESEGIFTIVGHGYLTGQKIQIQGTFAPTGWNTLLQYKFYTVEVLTVDTFKLKYSTTFVNTSALADAYTTGFTSITCDFYALKPTADIKLLTGGNSAATDNFSAAGTPNANFLALFEKVVIPLQENGYAFRFGNAKNKVLECTAVHDSDWVKACAGLPEEVSSVSAGGSNQFGADYYYQWYLAECAPVRAGGWDYASIAGVWGLVLNGDRTGSSSYVSARSCLYL